MAKALEINDPPEKPIEDDDSVEIVSDQPLANMNDDPPLDEDRPAR